LEIVSSASGKHGSSHCAIFSNIDIRRFCLCLMVAMSPIILAAQNQSEKITAPNVPSSALIASEIPLDDGYFYHEDSALKLGLGFDPSDPRKLKKPCLDYEVIPPEEGPPPSTECHEIYVHNFEQLESAAKVDVSVEARAIFAETDFRYRMMVSANIDLYPNDDEVAAIGKYLTAAGDWRLTVPDDVANWIISRIGHLGPEATPRLISAYMHFLRNNADSPPFDAGSPDSARIRILHSIVEDLKHEKTPACELALLMFREINDPDMRQLADAGNYDSLKSYPWLVGHEPWTNWILTGLDPYSSKQNPQPKVLSKVRSIVAGLDIKPPVSESVINFLDYTDDPRGWGQLKGDASVPHAKDDQLLSQDLAFASLLSRRFAAMLNLPPASDKRLEDKTRLAFSLGMVQPPPLADLYRDELGIPSSSPTEDRFDELYRTFVSQQRRMMALAVYALIVHQRTHHGAAVDLGMDKVFKTLAGTALPPSERKTSIVPTISASEIKSVSATDLSRLSGCNPKSAVVLKRQVSLRAHIYLETIDARCTDDRHVRLSRAGYLSADMIEILRLNPYFFDILGLSLAQRDLYIQTAASEESPENIDLIRVNPSLSSAILLAVLAHPNTPWQFVRDVLLQDWPISIDWFSPGWRPPSGSNPSAVVLRSAAEFAKTQESFLAGQNSLFQWEARRHFLDGLRSTVNSLPAKVTQCRQVSHCQSDPSGPMNCTNSTECPTVSSGKDKIIQQFNRIVDETDAYLKTSTSLFDKPCVSPTGKDVITVAINQDTDEFITGYGHGLCFVAVQGSLRGYPEVVSKAIKRTLELDPRFFNRHQLDLLPSSDNWESRFVPALLHSAREVEEAEASRQYLKTTDLLYYLPSNPAPLSTIRSAADPLFGSPLDAMTAPLLETAAGMDLANDLASLQYFAGVLPPPLVPDNGLELSKAFMDKLRAQERSAIAQIYSQVDPQIANVKSQLRVQQPQQGFAIFLSLTIGDGGIVPGLSLSYGGAGFNVTLPTPSSATITPSFGPFQIPGLPLVFPGSFALGPFLPNLTVPLGPSGNSGTFPADPDSASSGSGVPSDNTSSAKFTAPPNAPVVSGAVSQVGNVQPDDTLRVSFNTQAPISSVNWNTLLASSNFVGRMWLGNELAIAKPLLTAPELASIQAGLLQPSFPVPLAKLIALKAAQASSHDPNLVVMVSFSQVLDSACSKSTWSNCGVAIRQALDRGLSDPKDILNLALLWAAAYDARYSELRKQGHLEKSTPDSEKISEELKSHIDPLEIAKDKIEDKVLKLLLGKLAFLVDVASSPWITALKISLNSSEIASDYDELELMNRSMQKQIVKQLTPFMLPEWKVRLNQAVDQKDLIITKP
jgi:hypothetical protein